MTFRLALLISGCAAAVLADPGKVAKDPAGAAGSALPPIVQFRHSGGQADLNGLAPTGGLSTGRGSAAPPVRSSSAAWGSAARGGSIPPLPEA